MYNRIGLTVAYRDGFSILPLRTNALVADYSMVKSNLMMKKRLTISFQVLITSAS